MKNNPLFVDSTKVHGDSVPTTFELQSVFLYENEKIHLYVLENRGEFHHEIMKLNEKNGHHSTHLYLPHQSRLKYQFVIKNGEKIIFKSQQYSDLAKYKLEISWSPCLEVEILEPPQNQEYKSKKRDFVANGYSSSNLEKIIKKWGF